MKKLFAVSFLLLSLVAGLAFSYLYQLSEYFSDDRFPEDRYLDSCSVKRAAIIVAHDDDAVAFAGTISKLCAMGWKVDYLTFYGNWKKEENSTRKAELKKACNIQGIENMQTWDLPIQRTDTVSKPWLAIPYNQFENYFQGAALNEKIVTFLKQSNPQVVFTLDDVMGGYGHPEHTFISRLVLKACDSLNKNADNKINRIYQVVFTPELNEKVIGKMETFQTAKRIYGIQHSPMPDVSVVISDYSEQKMETMKAYITQEENIAKIWPYFNWYPHKIYFGVLNKEYFVVKKLLK